MPFGIYISLPFCRTKCSYCNFASDVSSPSVFGRYVDRLCGDIARACERAAKMGGVVESGVDSIYLGGGTPTMLEPGQVERIFTKVRTQFEVSGVAEITVECAPGTLTDSMRDCLLRCGVNRVSLGVQSFADQEAAAVGRLHKRATVLDDIARLRDAGITNINIDLIAGLPHQTRKSWDFSLAETIAAGAPHVSVYMLEIDEDSRLGRELIAGGTRYHAHFAPDEDATADFYLVACERLQSAGIAQYEISNFAREGYESRHNLKYWQRHPYLGFGVDAHSMLTAMGPETEAVRFACPDSLDAYIGGAQPERTVVSQKSAIEESLFLGLRLTRGVNLCELASKFGETLLENACKPITELVAGGLLERDGECLRLTSRGRLLSNEVFEKFILADEVTC